MLTLTIAVSQTKLLLKWFAILLPTFIIVIMMTNFVLTLIDPFPPTRPPPPTVAFGKLPQTFFPKSVTDKILTYSLDTVTGTFPNLPAQVKVYKMVETKPEFLALDTARQNLTRQGFRFNETQISKDLYRWVDKVTPSREITYNLFSHDFNLSSTFLSDPLLSQSLYNFTDESTAINTSRKFLSAISSYPDDIDLAKTKLLLYSIIDNNLVPATSVSSSNVIRVDFFQKSIDELPIYYSNYSTSTINLLVIAIKKSAMVVGANFHYQPISTQSYTYPIKTTSEAFNELKNHKAYISSYFNDNLTVAIKNISLGYFVGAEKQNFLMPIIIFEGENGFIAYVSAVRDEWINN